MKDLLTREDFIKRFKSVDADLFKEFETRKYKFHGSPGHNWADGLCQKCVWDDRGNKLFYIDCYVYIYDERFPNAKRSANTSVESDFYLNDNDDKHCTVSLSTRDLDWAEKFLNDFFYEHKCRIYERAN